MVRSQALNCSEDTQPGEQVPEELAHLAGRQDRKSIGTAIQARCAKFGGAWQAAGHLPLLATPKHSQWFCLAGAPPGEMPGGQGPRCSLFITLALQVASFTPGLRRAQSWSSLNEEIKWVQLSKLQWCFPQMVGRGYQYPHGSCCSCQHFLSPVGNSSLQPGLHVPECWISSLGVPLNPKTQGNVGGIVLGSDLGLKLFISSLCSSAASPVERRQEPSCFGYQQCSVDGSCSHWEYTHIWAPLSCSVGTQRASEGTRLHLPLSHALHPEDGTVLASFSFLVPTHPCLPAGSSSIGEVRGRVSRPLGCTWPAVSGHESVEKPQHCPAYESSLGLWLWQTTGPSGNYIPNTQGHSWHQTEHRRAHSLGGKYFGKSKYKKAYLQARKKEPRWDLHSNFPDTMGKSSK